MHSKAITPDSFKYAISEICKTGHYRLTHFHPLAMTETVRALAGAPCTIVVRGFAYRGHLMGTRQTPGYGTFQVLVVTEHNRTWFQQDDVLVVIPDSDRPHAEGGQYERQAIDAAREVYGRGDNTEIHSGISL